MSRNVVVTGVAFPKSLLDMIDKQRGDVSRSRYISRCVEMVMAEKQRKEKGKK